MDAQLLEHLGDESLAAVILMRNFIQKPLASLMDLICINPTLSRRPRTVFSLSGLSVALPLNAVLRIVPPANVSVRRL